jgi:hypothetical protein
MPAPRKQSPNSPETDRQPSGRAMTRAEALRWWQAGYQAGHQAARHEQRATARWGHRRLASRPATAKDPPHANTPGPQASRQPSGAAMTYLIAEPGIDVKDKNCTGEGPAGCTCEGERMPCSHPGECGACGRPAQWRRSSAKTTYPASGPSSPSRTPGSPASSARPAAPSRPARCRRTPATPPAGNGVVARPIAARGAEPRNR